MQNFNVESFTDLTQAISRMGISVHALVGVLSLVGDETVTPDGRKMVTPEVIYKAWQIYQSSPAFKSLGTQGTTRAAS